MLKSALLSKFSCEYLGLQDAVHVGHALGVEARAQVEHRAKLALAMSSRDGSGHRLLPPHLGRTDASIVLRSVNLWFSSFSLNNAQAREQ